MGFEKQEYGFTTITQQPGRDRSTVGARRLLEYCGIAGMVWFSLNASSLVGKFARPVNSKPCIAKAFSWDDIAIKSSLDYRPCFDGHQCARLELPMDYWNGTTDAKIALAIIRKPAVVAITHPLYAGAILTNPGGPGGSGVGFLQRGGDGLRAIVDSNDAKYYDLISFDPRGVGATTPGVHCFQDPSADFSWQLRLLEEGWSDSSDAAFGRLWSMSDARGRSCSLPLADEGGDADIRKFVTTASVARDMLEIVEHHAEWREMEARRLLEDSESMVPEPLKHRHGEEKINYIGFSYGTYLGQTFAAMYPDRIGKFVVDGVVDTVDYRKVHWQTNLVDTEKVMDGFYTYCARAGYPACPLASDGHGTASAVKMRVLNITLSLLHNPLAVVGPNAEVITYSDVRTMLFAALYSPVQTFPPVARLLADLEQGNGTAFAAVLRASHTYSCKSNDQKGGLNSDALFAIACTDGDDQTHVSRSDFKAYQAKLANMSPTIGSFWATVRMNCIQYHIRAPYRFTGPWIGNTSNPILFIGNTADPVTPGINAINGAKGFEGAVALIQDGSGHCAVGGASYSRCTIAHVREYFLSGAMPPVGTVCTVDNLPWGVESALIEDEDIAFATARELQPDLANALLDHGGFLNNALLGSIREGIAEM